ncbi:hypothetical protein LOD99_12530 [Oopsacas minuta]|uniref:Generative cell specific-1/HAP2 domain-containing protein n=1 Tax=Oopsacas minuta TaxID=111878 RepID=A0AAV7JCB2_9METZ|nr:hypothetical protein LOD99_12530 [Oopsacas minuta]
MSFITQVNQPNLLFPSVYSIYPGYIYAISHYSILGGKMILQKQLLYILFLFVRISLSFDLLASSSLETCIKGRQAQVNNMDGSPCTRKLVISVSIPSGGGGTEKLESKLVSKVNGMEGTSLLEKPIRISIIKSQSRVSYRIRKIGRVNYKPREKILYFNGCNENIYKGKLVCNTVKLDGITITDSHGRCCKCDLGNKLGQNYQWTRSKLKCGLIGVSETGHCMRLHPVFMDVFEFLAPQIIFKITVIVTEKTVEGWNRIGRVVVSPSSSHVSLLNGQVLVELIGDFAPKAHFFTLHSKLLLVPENKSYKILKRGQSDWLVLEKDQVDLSGTQCNKVGVWFQAFRHQENFCSLRNGSCLLNQPEDIWRINNERRKRGRSFRGLLSYYGKLRPTRIRRKIPDYSIQFENDNLGRSEVVVTLTADELKFIVHKSAGKIVSAYVEDFEALTQQGNAMLLVLNEGNLTASYHLGIYRCSAGIELPHGRIVTLNPGASSSYNFTIYSHHPIHRENQCFAYLRDSRGNLMHEINFTFETYSTCFCPAYCPCSCGNVTQNNSSNSTSPNIESEMNNMTYAKYLSNFCVEESEVSEVDVVVDIGGYVGWNEIGEFIDNAVAAIENVIFGGIQNFLLNIIRFLPLILLVSICGISIVLLVIIRIYKMVVNGEFSIPELTMFCYCFKNLCLFVYQNFHILCFKFRSKEEKSMGSFRASKNSAFIRPTYCNGLCDGAKQARNEYRKEMRIRLRNGLRINKAWWDDPYNCTCLVNARMSAFSLVKGFCFFMYCCFIPAFWCIRHLFFHLKKRKKEKKMYKEFEQLFLPKEEGDDEKFKKLYKNHRLLLLSDSDTSSDSENDLQHVDSIEELIKCPSPVYINSVGGDKLSVKSLISHGAKFSLKGRLKEGQEGIHIFSLEEFPVQYYKQENDIQILLKVSNSLLPSDYNIELNSQETFQLVTFRPEYLCLNEELHSSPPPYPK